MHALIYHILNVASMVWLRFNLLEVAMFEFCSNLLIQCVIVFLYEAGLVQYENFVSGFL